MAQPFRRYPRNRRPRRSFSDILKNLFFIILILQFAPTMIVGIKTAIQETVSPKAKVGYLTVRGMISNSTFYTKKIEEFEKNPNIQALVLKIESPGGLPGSAQAIFNELQEFKKKKPIIAFVENMGASAAYYVAAAANKIIANPSSLVGSIGVLMQIPNVKGLLDSWKVNVKHIQSGKFKTAGSPVKESSQEELNYLQSLANSSYKQFISDIARSRQLSLKDHTKWANGKVFTGTQALELKLIDQIGSFRTVKDEIRKIAEIPDDQEIKFISGKKRPSGLLRFLVGDEEHGSELAGIAESSATFLHNVYSKFVSKEINEKQAVTLQ